MRKQSSKEVAPRIFPHLVRLAEDHRTERYGKFSETIGWGHARSINRALVWLMFWCDTKGLPPLTCLIVNGTGLPGHGLTTVDTSKAAQLEARQRVFEYPWRSVSAPTIGALEEARSKSER